VGRRRARESCVRRRNGVSGGPVCLLHHKTFGLRQIYTPYVSARKILTKFGSSSKGIQEMTLGRKKYSGDDKKFQGAYCFRMCYDNIPEK